MEKKSKYEYNKKYAEAYLSKMDEIRIRLPNGKKDDIKAHADSMGESVNAFINRAIQRQIEADKAKGQE